MNMKRVSALVGGVMLGASSLLAGTACHRSYVTVDASGDAAYYDYQYYPDSEVYFYPSQRVYYWHDHDRWEHGRDLPSHIRVERERSVQLRLRTANPYEQHVTVRAQHPPGHEHHDGDRR